MSWLTSLKAVFAGAPELNAEQIQQHLADYILPVSLDETETRLETRISQVQLNGRVLQLSIKTYPHEAEFLQQIHDELSQQLQPLGITELNLHVVQQKAQQHPQQTASSDQPNLPPVQDAAADPNNPPIQKAAPQQRDVPAHPRIRQVVVVASGKGGVGKSTTTVNLALALQQQGLKVGVLDADIYGPSIPTMLGNAGQSPLIENEQFVPLEAYGMPVLSIGHLTGDGNTPVAWRGPKATGALMQLFNQTNWPQLDVLLIDMPPGTGDIQLTLAQRIPVAGAVIVTTPQNVALLDASKGIELFNKVNIPILGVVENMSTHICSNCGFEEQIFGVGGGDQLSKQYAIRLLGRLPLDASIRANADLGKPSVLLMDAAAESYINIAKALMMQLQQLPSYTNAQRIF